MSDLDLQTPEHVANLMSSSKSEDEWNTNCNAVKKANGGYPSFWYPTIVMSGLLNRTASKFGASAEIKVAGVR